MLPSDMDGTSAAPLYAQEPAFDERTLECTLPYFERAVPTGTYTHADEHLRLTLQAQVDGTKLPSYGRHGLVRGEVIISEPKGITSVDIQVRRNQCTIAFDFRAHPITNAPLLFSAGRQTRDDTWGNHQTRISVRQRDTKLMACFLRSFRLLLTSYIPGAAVL